MWGVGGREQRGFNTRRCTCSCAHTGCLPQLRSARLTRPSLHTGPHPSPRTVRSPLDPCTGAALDPCTGAAAPLALRRRRSRVARVTWALRAGATEAGWAIRPTRYLAPMQPPLAPVRGATCRGGVECGCERRVEGPGVAIGARAARSYAAAIIIFLTHVASPNLPVHLSTLLRTSALRPRVDRRPKPAARRWGPLGPATAPSNCAKVVSQPTSTR